MDAIGVSRAVHARAIPADLTTIIAKLRAHNIRVSAITAPMTVEGDRLVVERITNVRGGGLARGLGVDRHPVVYPIFKYRRQVK